MTGPSPWCRFGEAFRVGHLDIQTAERAGFSAGLRTQIQSLEVSHQLDPLALILLG